MTRLRWLRALLVLGALGLAALVVAPSSGAGGPVGPSESVAAVAGFTKIAVTSDYVVMVNVLPGEHMYTAGQYAHHHPTVGELIIDGAGAPVQPWTRHVEAHVYSRSTGEVALDVMPTFEINDRTTGRITTFESTAMQDVIIGLPDRHFGNNVIIPPGHPFTLTVTIAGQPLRFGGRL